MKLSLEVAVESLEAYLAVLEILRLHADFEYAVKPTVNSLSVIAEYKTILQHIQGAT